MRATREKKLIFHGAYYKEDLFTFRVQDKGVSETAVDIYNCPSVGSLYLFNPKTERPPRRMIEGLDRHVCTQSPERTCQVTLSFPDILSDNLRLYLTLKCHYQRHKSYRVRGSRSSKKIKFHTKLKFDHSVYVYQFHLKRKRVQKCAS